MSERPTMSDGSPFDPTDSVHVAERLSVVATEQDRLAARLAEVRRRTPSSSKLNTHPTAEDRRSLAGAARLRLGRRGRPGRGPG